MPILNVRLGPDDQRIAAALRRAGVPVSSLVREALRAELKRVRKRRSTQSPSEVVESILAEIPVGPRERAGAPSTHRRAVQRLVRAKLGRRG